MGNKTGKFDVPKTDAEVKENNDVPVAEENQEIIKEEKVEAVLESEPKQNGDATESKDVVEDQTEEKKDEVVEEGQKTETVETTEVIEHLRLMQTCPINWSFQPKKKGVIGWLKKISFRKDKKPLKTSDENVEGETKDVKIDEVHTEETPATEAVVTADESAKVEESKSEEIITVEETKKGKELIV